jgi:hypothetical protein
MLMRKFVWILCGKKGVFPVFENDFLTSYGRSFVFQIPLLSMAGDKSSLVTHLMGE